jgi:hypothetical protein
MTVRRLLFLAVVLAGVVLGAHPAAAGGSNWSTDRASYAPGDTALLIAAVAWSHNGTLGTPEEGPYGVWLAPAPGGFSEDIEPTPGAVYVGDIDLDVVDRPIGPHIASVEFVVPDLPAGDYAIQHCNVPCTTSLGDITFGQMHIASTPTTTAVPRSTTTTTAVTPLVAEGGTSGWGRLGQFGLGLGGGLVLVAIVWLGWGRRQPTTKPA